MEMRRGFYIITGSHFVNAGGAAGYNMGHNNPGYACRSSVMQTVVELGLRLHP